MERLGNASVWNTGIHSKTYVRSLSWCHMNKYFHFGNIGEKTSVRLWSAQNMINSYEVIRLMQLVF